MPGVGAADAGEDHEGSSGSKPSPPEVALPGRTSSAPSSPAGRPAPAPVPGPCGSVPLRRGLRILSLDGGGVRGMMEVEMLREIETRTGRRIHELFDLIAGCSTGGYLATMVGIKRWGPDDCIARYDAIRTQFGGQSAVYTELKRYTIGESHSGKGMEKYLKADLGDEELGRTGGVPKVCVVSAAVDMFPPQPYIFRNYELSPDAFAKSEFLGTSKCKVWEAVRATTAAPTYHSPAQIGSQKFVDGAVCANNPVCVALSEAALLWPGVPVELVVSLGTGLPTLKPLKTQSVVAWVRTLVELSMSSHVSHKVAASILGTRYCRLDPDGEFTAEVDLVEDRDEVLKKMVAACKRYIARKRTTFDAIAEVLVGTRASPAAAVTAALPSLITVPSPGAPVLPAAVSAAPTGAPTPALP